MCISYDPHISSGQSIKRIIFSPVGVKAANLRLMGASECHRPVDNHPHLVSHLSALKHMLALFHDLLVVTDSYSSLPLTLLSCSHGSNSPLLELWLCALTAQPPGYITLIWEAFCPSVSPAQCSLAFQQEMDRKYRLAGSRDLMCNSCGILWHFRDDD